MSLIICKSVWHEKKWIKLGNTVKWEENSVWVFCIWHSITVFLHQHSMLRTLRFWKWSPKYSQSTESSIPDVLLPVPHAVLHMASNVSYGVVGGSVLLLGLFSESSKFVNQAFGWPTDLDIVQEDDSFSPAGHLFLFFAGGSRGP